MKKPPVLAALQKAAKGLVFISETEAELEPFVWEDGDDLTAERVLRLAGLEGDTAVVQQTLPQFFRAVSKADKPKFDALAKVLQEHLSGIQVFKLGELEKTVYIVGKTSSGHWAGLKTRVVET